MLSQHKYVLNILCHAGMSSCKLVDTPASVSKLDLSSTVLFSDPTRFRQIVGALQYLTFTRPDICYAVNKVCQFMHAPTESHWATVQRILRYLKGTTSYGIHLTRGFSLSLHGFTNADWAGSVDDQKSTGGYIVFLVPHLFHGNLRSNALLLAPPLKQSIKLWLMVLLRFFGYAIF